MTDLAPFARVSMVSLHTPAYSAASPTLSQSFMVAS